MLHISSADRILPLAAALAEVLAEPLDDPMMPEWVAVPTVGMHRWLSLELARSLGASGIAGGDGVAANITFSFPGALRQAVLNAGRDTGSLRERPDPWRVEQLVWAVLDVLRSGADDARLLPLTELPPGATWFGRARRLADLLDRYAVRRPDLVIRWSAGHDVDTSGRPLQDHDRWQPHLWRLTRARIGEPSPPERMPALLDSLRAGSLSLDLPPRLAVFGVTTLPGGEAFLDLVDAVAAHRDLHLLLLDPSPPTTARVRAATLVAPERRNPIRADDPSGEAASHPLLRSWGRPYRERAVLLAAAEARGVAEPRYVGTLESADTATPRSLLARIQQDLRCGAAPAGDLDLDPDDHSVQIHSCHGEARQVEVLRDAILHLLTDDPTLHEEDIVVLCPTIERFAPLIESGLGASAADPGAPASAATPRLLYHVTDRSLRDSHPVLAALDALLELVSGRCTAPETIEFLSMPPVRRRFELDDSALATISGWITDTNVRWGLTGEHRAAWGLPAELTSNTWQVALDRVLMGVAVSDDGVALAPGDIAPLGVEGSDIIVAGRFADVVTRIAAVAREMERPRSAAGWCAALSWAGEQLFDVDTKQHWQMEKMRQIIVEIGEEAVVAGEPAAFDLTLADVRRLLSERLREGPRRPDFFRGGITISSLTPLRWLPFRVVALLGFDEAGIGDGAGLGDGDDLAALAPRLGDHDPRAEIRQAILEAVLAAGDHLIVTRTGHDVRTNQEVPGAVALSELRDVIAATLAPSSRVAYADRIEISHPRQPFDDRCFRPGLLHPNGPWSFDAIALSGARARAQRVDTRRPFMESPLVSPPGEELRITLAELHSFLRNPVRHFLTRRLGLHLLGEDHSISGDLPTTLTGLERWRVADRLLGARLAGYTDDDWERYERALGTVPAGGLGDTAVADVRQTVDDLLARAIALGVEPIRHERHPVDVELAGAIRIVGVIEGRCAPPNPGPATVTYTRAAPRQHVAAWLDLMALAANWPGTNWRSVVIRRAAGGKRTDSLALAVRGESPEQRRSSALAALEVALDCYRRGMREPIPLFASISQKLHARSAKPNDWKARDDLGDGRDEAVLIAFGDLELNELLALPARDDDPPGTATGRARRFADYLWGAIEESSEMPA